MQKEKRVRRLDRDNMIPVFITPCLNITTKMPLYNIYIIQAMGELDYSLLTTTNYNSANLVYLSIIYHFVICHLS